MAARLGPGDDELLERLGEDTDDTDGAAAALDVLFERYGDFVHNLVFRRTASWSVAEDIVGVVFLELWRQRRRLVTQAGSLRPWLVAVAVNQVKRTWAGQARQRALAERSPHAVPETDHADDVAARLDDERRMRHLNAELADLPTPYRDVLTLWAWEQLDHAEIAAALGVAVGTVKSRLHRARARLRASAGTAAVGPAYPVESPIAVTDRTPPGRGEEGGRR